MRKENLTYKPLSEFEGGDSIYISKMHGDYQAFYLCKFISLERGIVTAIVDDHAGAHCRVRTEETIRAKASKCMLWGHGHGDINTRCHWFRKVDSEWRIT